MATAEELGYSKPVGTDEIKYGDDAISRNADRCAGLYNTLFDQRWARGLMPNGSNLSTWAENGWRYITTAQNSNTMHDGTPGTPALPVSGAGFYGSLRGGTGQRVEWWVTTGASGMQTTWNRRGGGAWKRMEWEVSGALSNTTDLDALPSGSYHVWTSAVAAALGLPPSAGGVLKMDVITAGVKIMRFTPYNLDEEWKNRRNNGPWLGWKRVDLPAPPASSGSGGTGSGFKTVPLALTLPSVGNTTTAITERRERYMMGWNAPVTRWRIHIRNGEYRIGQFASGSLNINGLWFGEHSMPSGTPTGDFTNAPKQVHGATVTPADGSEWISPWISEQLSAGTQYLLSLGFTAATGQRLYYHVGNSWSNASAASAADLTAGGGSGLPVLDVWIEAETLSGTPVVASIGDSIACGVGAKSSVADSWIAKYAWDRRALPVHWGGSSETLSNSLNAGDPKWARWPETAKADAVIVALGSNDIFGAGTTLGTLQTQLAQLAPILKAYVSDTIHLGTITPRTAVTGTQEDTRRGYNTWLRSRPLGVRDVFDFAAAVSTDDEILNPAYDSDGIHLNTAGYQAMREAITRPITAPPILYATL